VNNKTSLVIKILVLLFGVAMIVTGVGALQSNSASWPSARAKIVSSTLHSSGNSSNNSAYDITYDYQVDGVQYSGAFTSDLETYRKEDALIIYYDPNSPGNSITSPGEMETYGIIGILFGLFCVGGIGWDGIKSMLAKRQGAAAAAGGAKTDQGG